MGKTQILGSLVNTILTDSSNNVGLGGAANASFKLQVTGATNLTGALTGAAATFSGNLEVFNSGAGQTAGDFIVNPTTKYVYVGRQSTTSGDNTTFVVRDRTGTARATIPGGGSIDTVFSTNSSNFKITNYSGTDLLSISNTGAATFSSSVTTGGNVTLNSSSLLRLGNSDNASTMQIWNSQSGAANNFLIYDNAASAYRFVISNTGNVGIGTTSPSQLLHIQKDQNTATNLLIRNDSSGASAEAYMNVSNGTYLTAIGTRGTGTAAYNSLDTNSGMLNYNGNTSLTINATDASAVIKFTTNNFTERMRITSGGGIKIYNGTNPPTGNGLELFYNGTSGVIGGYDRDTSTFKQLYFFGSNTIFENGGSERMRITSGGDLLLKDTGGNTAMTFTQVGSNIIQGNTSNLILQSTGFNIYLRPNASYRTYIDGGTGLSITGSLSKGSGSFRIEHPLESLSSTHDLVHSFVESPQANNIYRGKVQLVNGKAEVNLDEVSTMTEGTFVALNREIHTYTSNETDWDAVRGIVNGNIITIECQNNQSNAFVTWLVIGERQDKHMMDTEWTDDNGKVIVEPLKEIKNTETL